MVMSYYNCGRIDNFLYVYDSSDGSCELVSMDKLANIGVDILEIEKSAFNLHKMRMMYSFEDFGVYCGLGLCLYTVDFKDKNDFKLRLSLNIFKADNILTRYRGSKRELERFCYNNKYLLFFSVIPCYRSYMNNLISSIPKFRHVSCLGEKFIGLPVPLQMFDYIVMMASNHDFIGIVNAFGGFIFENLSIKNDKWFFDKEKLDLSEVVWRI